MDFDQYQKQANATESADFVEIEKRIQKIGRERITELLSRIQKLAALLDHAKRAIFYGTENSMQVVYAKLPIEMDENTAPEVSIPMLTCVQILRLFHALLGIGSEAGEIAVPVREFMMNRTGIQSALSKFDPTNISEEGGDVQWYLALLQDSVDCTLDDAADANIRKLRERYPDKFNEYDAQIENRDLNAERKQLESDS